MRALWIEIEQQMEQQADQQSRPVRALWIEIALAVASFGGHNVEAREGLVD